ncbi:MAG TPA: 30S ribosome-binding factor RbfA [Bacteroidota bacterium]
MSVRTERVASIVKEEIGVIFQRNFEMKEYGFMTVTEVRMTPDLKIAKVYVSVFGDATKKQKTLSMLESQKGFVRQTLGRNIKLKFTPSIVFYLDETMDNAMNLEKIFKQIHNEGSGAPGPEDKE